MIILDAQTGLTHLKWDIHTKKRTKKKLQEQVQVTAPDLDKRYVSVYHALRGLPRKLTVMSVRRLILTTFPMSDHHEIAMVDASWKK